MMSELELVKMELDNLISGMEIRKAIDVDWWEDDERELQLLQRIHDLLERTKEVKTEDDTGGKPEAG